MVTYIVDLTKTNVLFPFKFDKIVISLNNEAHSTSDQKSVSHKVCNWYKKTI